VGADLVSIGRQDLLGDMHDNLRSAVHDYRLKCFAGEDEYVSPQNLEM
jgi:hypothetical protein